MRFYIQTLGCKINQYESQAIREAWLARGMEEASEVSRAELIVVHTCAVTAKAVADGRNAVRRAGRAAPGAVILAAGCAAQCEPAGFAALPGVRAVIAQADKPGLCLWPDDPFLWRTWAESFAPAAPGPAAPLVSVGAPAAPPRPVPSARPAWPDFSIASFHRARPILKIQDGCSQGCTYCIVPRARGAARSRPFALILEEARRLLAAGHRELVLSGINLGQFALDSPPGDFWDLLAALEAALAPQWGGTARLRLSSLDPGMLTAKAVDMLGRSSMICPHLHISLQSADPGVLAAMGRRHYFPGAVAAFLGELRTAWPLFALGADLLTGFPGESAEAFAATLAFCADMPLTYAHVFPYSRRPGTVAAKARGQVPNPVKKERAARLRLAVQDKEAAFALRLAGLPLLCVAPEQRARNSPLTGVCEYYTECTLRGPCPEPSLELVSVRPAGARSGRLVVETA